MTDLGSYDFSSFRTNQTEYERLKAQANVAKDIEKAVLTQHGLRTGQTVLDLGCGPGFVTRHIAEIAAPGDVTGGDLNTELLGIAKHDLAANPMTNLNFTMANIYDLSPFARQFDFAYCRFLFQHLERPVEALRQIRGALKPGGRLLILDVDDGWVTLYPEHPTYEAIFHAQRRTQKERGGDRLIGRKLFDYMTEAGFVDVKPAIMTLTSVELGIDTFIELTTGYKIELLKDATLGELTPEKIATMKKECSAGRHTGYIGVYNVSGARA